MTRAAEVSETHRSLAPARAALASRGDDILATQIAITEIPAPTGDESERAQWVAKRFARIRLADVRTDGAGNVIGTYAASANAGAASAGAASRHLKPHRLAPVVVCAHLDTVFPRDAITSAQRVGTRVQLPGIGDNGRGLAAMLAIAHALTDARVITHRDVVFVATTGEEGDGDLRGAKHFFAENAASAAIALDGTGDTRVVHRAVGSRRFRVTFDGPGGHSWSDFGVANPLHASATAVAKLASLRLPTDPRTTVTVSRASGGLSVNTIPQRAWFEVDIRSTSDEPVSQIEDALRGIVAQAVLETNAVRRPHTPSLFSHISLIGSRPAGELPVTEPLVEIAQAATHLVAREPELAHASTDANVPLSLGIPAIAIGGGGLGGDVHTTAEWYDDTDGLRGIERVMTVVVAAADIGP